MCLILLTISLTIVSLSNANNDQNLVLTSSHDNSPLCNCYVVSGPNQGYFQYHRFWDFRSVPNDVLPASIPSLPTSPIEDMDPSDPADLTSKFFNTDEWIRDWSIQNFSNVDLATGGKYKQVASPRNVWVSGDCGSDGLEHGGGNTCLVLRSARQEEGWQSVAEVDSRQGNLWRSSVRARLRVVPTVEFVGTGGGNDNESGSDGVANGGKGVAEGAVLGFFTYGSDTSESDIEVLTRDPAGKIRYSNQPDYDQKKDEAVPGASTDSLLPEGKRWTDWITYRLDWFEDVSQWWVDEDLVLNKTVNVPGTPGGFIMNLWGDGGEWSGVMKVGSEVRVEVQWVQMAFNVSGDIRGPERVTKVKREIGLERRKDKKCNIGCAVDGQGIASGYPTVLFNSTSEGNRLLGAVEGNTWCLLVAQLAILVCMVQLLQ